MNPRLVPRVLQVLTRDGAGGTEHMVATLAKHADSREVKMIVVTLAPSGPVAGDLRAGGVPVASLGERGMLRALGRLARLLARERFNVVSAYGLRGTMLCRVMVPLLSPGTRFVSGVRGLHVFEVQRVDGLASRIVLALERLASPLVDVYDVNSPGARELLAEAGVPRRKIKYIPNGIEPAHWRVESRASGRTPTILCVARFTPVKRQIDLIAAAELLAEAGLDFRLTLVGDGPSLSKCRAAAASVGDLILFEGAVERGDVRRFLAQADIFCLPSRWEGMPGSVMEAMVAGLPVVGTQVNGIADLVVDGETGLLVPPEDPEALAGALQGLLEDPEQRRRMGEGGRERIAEHFTLDGMLRAKEKLYRELVVA